MRGVKTAEKQERRRREEGALETVVEGFLHDEAKTIKLRAVVIDGVVSLNGQREKQLDRCAKLISQSPPMAVVVGLHEKREPRALALPGLTS